MDVFYLRAYFDCYYPVYFIHIHFAEVMARLINGRSGR